MGLFEDIFGGIEQGLSGGKGWAGFAGNVAKGLPQIGDILSGLGGLAGSVSKADLAKMSRRDYNDLLNRAYDLYTGGEERFLEESERALPELEELKSQIQDETGEYMQDYASQLASSLAQKGIRGGQAANILARGIGDVRKQGTRDILQKSYEDAMRRSGARMGYFGGKAGTGQSGTLGG